MKTLSAESFFSVRRTRKTKEVVINAACSQHNIGFHRRREKAMPPQMKMRQQSPEQTHRIVACPLVEFQGSKDAQKVYFTFSIVNHVRRLRKCAQVKKKVRSKTEEEKSLSNRCPPNYVVH